MDSVMPQSELSKRVVTASIGVAVLLGLIIFAGSFGVFLIATVISLGMLFEFANIVFDLDDRVAKRYAVLCLALFLCAVNYVMPRYEFELALVTFLTLFIYFLITAQNHEQENFSHHFRELMYSYFGITYLVLIPMFLVKMREIFDGSLWVILFLCIVWSNDIAAYFVGKKFGKRKVYPKISPKKTVEGALGGLLAGVLIALVFKLSVFPRLSFGGAIFIPLVVGVFAQMGDFCESFLKRAFDTKDSGSILPGHGGFLDRFDGVVFSLPVMYAFIRLFS